MFLTAVTLAGCSQVAALAPVSGDALTTVRAASIDVLLAADVPVSVVPVCATSSGMHECTGETTDGAAIRVSAPTQKPLTMVVVVGDRQVYDGPVQDVLDKVARGESAIESGSGS